MTTTDTKPNRFNIGRRFAVATDYANPARRTGPLLPKSKLARRIMRKLILKHQSAIERSIRSARGKRLEAESLADNSHEAKRFAAQLGITLHRRPAREMDIENYAPKVRADALTRFARGQR